MHSNDTIQLPCLVRKSPNTIVIWNQCEDPFCNQLRIPLTVNKNNFIEDLRFRVLSENVNTTVKNEDLVEKVKETNSNANNNLIELAEIAKSNLNSWNLEIRRFTKLDEACYQCQLNSFKVKTIHYCIKLLSKKTIFFYLLKLNLNCLFNLLKLN